MKNKIIIEPSKNTKGVIKELWMYRELFLLLAWKDILIRYKQTIIGVAWSVIRPVLTMIILTFVFWKVGKLPDGGVPYPLLVYSATLPWQFFSNAITVGSNSIVGNEKLVTKVYFPRIIIPTTSLVVSFVDFSISFLVYLALMLYYQVAVTWTVVTLPLFILIASMFSLGIVYFVSALNVTYRDFRYIIPFIVQIGMYISPVGFSTGIVPDKYIFLYSMNPMVGVIDGFRWALLGAKVEFYLPGFIISVIISVLIFVLGYRFFYSTERKFADVI